MICLILELETNGGLNAWMSFFTSFLGLISKYFHCVRHILHIVFFLFIPKEKLRTLIYLDMEYESFCHHPISDVVLYSMFLNLLQTFYWQYVFLPL